MGDDERQGTGGDGGIGKQLAKEPINKKGGPGGANFFCRRSLSGEAGSFSASSSVETSGSPGSLQPIITGS